MKCDHCSAHSHGAESAVAECCLCSCMGTLWHHAPYLWRLLCCAAACPTAAHEALSNGILSISTVSRATAELTTCRVNIHACGPCMIAALSLTSLKNTCCQLCMQALCTEQQQQHASNDTASNTHCLVVTRFMIFTRWDAASDCVSPSGHCTSAVCCLLCRSRGTRKRQRGGGSQLAGTRKSFTAAMETPSQP